MKIRSLIFLIILALASLIPVSAFATDASCTVTYPAHNRELGVCVETLTANATLTLPVDFVGGYLYVTEVVTSLDDAITVTIRSPSNTTMATVTTTSATTGEWLIPSGAWYPFTGRPILFVGSLGSGNAVVTITFVKERGRP